MDRDFVETWGRSFLEAWNAHDVDAVVSLCSEGLTLDDPALPETLRGHDGMRRFAQATFRAPMEGYIRRMLWALADTRVIPEEATYDPHGPSLADWERDEVRRETLHFAEV